MDTAAIDERLRAVYETNAPVVNETAFRARLRNKVGRRRNRVLAAVCLRRRPAVLAVTAVIVVGLAAVGVLEMAKLLGPNDPVLTIDGQTMNPGGTGSAATEAVPSTVPEDLTGDKAELLAQIRYIRAGLESGTLALDWPPSATSTGDLPSDPLKMLDSLERSVTGPDVTLYLRDAVGEVNALRSEIVATPGVSRVVLVSKEEALEELQTIPGFQSVVEGLVTNPLPTRLDLWLEDYHQANVFVSRFGSRPEVDECRASQRDYAAWTVRLRGLTREDGNPETGPAGR